VCPGGAYSNLVMSYEGEEVAQWLNDHGITAFILRYRHGPDYRYPAPVDDGHRAIRTVRARANEWDIDPKRIGMLGFSAGGHLASTIGTHFTRGKTLSLDRIERASSRPDFLILAYPVVSLTEPHGHQGSAHNLLGPEPDPKLQARLSNETQVTKKTPPTFLMHTTTDQSVSSANSALFYQACRKAGVPAELHIFERGAHGCGLGQKDPALSVWPDLCLEWLRTRGILATP
jgi:acetyl esterase/lipase